MDWIQHPDRRREQAPFHGRERRAPDLIENPPGRNPGISTEPYADEMPKDPTPGDPGPDTRGQSSVIEKSREVERERSQNPTKPGEFSNT